MENKTFQSKQIGVIGGVTIVVSNVIAASLHFVDGDVWRNLLFVSISIVLFGVLFGAVSSKSQNVNRASWKVSVFLMSLGMSWTVIALLRLLQTKQ